MDALPPYNQPRAAAGRIVGPALRTWLRYIVPLTLLSALALSPVLVIALATRVPADAAAAAALRVRGWELVALAVLCQLVLVGGASAVTDRPSQLRAVGGGAVQLVRAVVPCLAAAAAIAIGSLALVVPGLLLLVLLALTGASRERGVAAVLQDSIAAVRQHLGAVTITVVALLVVDAAIAICAQRLLGAALPRRPTAAQLASARELVRAVALALVVVSPLPATVLATIRRSHPAKETGS